MTSISAARIAQIKLRCVVLQAVTHPACKPLPFRGGVGVGRISARRRLWTGAPPPPPPPGEGGVRS